MTAFANRSSRQRHAARGGSPMPIIASVCVAILVAGGAWWWFRMRRPDPAADAMKYLQASKTQDYATMYEYSVVNKAQFPTEAAYEAQHRAAIGMVPPALLKQVTDSLTFSLGKATVNGDEATVPVAFSVTVLGQSIHKSVPMRMHYSGSVWQVESGQQPGLGMPRSPALNQATPGR
ncbi:MAG: hypothetical protein KGJ62_13385 [Armatimonadetes bacterium]|nr:hypothetical protein [Armatimonadota bacterium]MDE2206845.1 hypothetical protein [Armatimonadota bacterium]